MSSGSREIKPLSKWIIMIAAPPPGLHLENTFGAKEAAGRQAISSGQHNNSPESVRKQKRANYCFSRRHKLTGKFPPSLLPSLPFVPNSILSPFLFAGEIARVVTCRPNRTLSNTAHILIWSSFPVLFVLKDRSYQTFLGVKVPFLRLHSVYPRQL